MKYCPTCKRTLDLSHFNIDKYTKDGHRYQCRDCFRMQRKQVISSAKGYRKRKYEKYKTRFKIARDKFQSKCISLGRCKRCSNSKLENSAHCLYHWTTSVANSLVYRIDKTQLEFKYTLTNYLLEKLKTIPYCPYTGEKLVPGLTASLDHKIPVSRDPSKALDLDNLEWVSIVFNQAKGNMTTEEFLDCYDLKSKHNFDRTVRVHMRKNYKWG